MEKEGRAYVFVDYGIKRVVFGVGAFGIDGNIIRE